MSQLSIDVRGRRALFSPRVRDAAADPETARPLKSAACFLFPLDHCAVHSCTDTDIYKLYRWVIEVKAIGVEGNSKATFLEEGLHPVFTWQGCCTISYPERSIDINENNPNTGTALWLLLGLVYEKWGAA